MIIKSITLINFRNHSEYHLECNDNTTLILGKNGCGKTSVLEAIYILTRGKSFRATDQDIIKRGTEFYRIELINNSDEKRVAIYDNKIKTFTVMDKKTRRLPKAYKYPLVLFLPSDLNLISGSPSRHREYFDHLFSIVDEEYNEELLKYEKALHQRNELLKQENIKEVDLFSWNLLLSKYGSLICSKRKKFIETINRTLSHTYFSIANTKDEISLSYKTEIISSNEDEYLKLLEQNFKKDQLLGHTSFGIHRDDFEFIFNHKAADGSASRGETRSIVLALKFTEAKLIEDGTNKKPIILLDDVFSELDQSRRQALIKNFKEHQIIITSVEEVNLTY